MLNGFIFVFTFVVLVAAWTRETYETWEQQCSQCTCRTSCVPVWLSWDFHAQRFHHLVALVLGCYGHRHPGTYRRGGCLSTASGSPLPAPGLTAGVGGGRQ